MSTREASPPPRHGLDQGVWPWLLLALAGLLQAAALAWPGQDGVEWQTALGLLQGQAQPVLQLLAMALALRVLTWAPSARRSAWGAWVWATVSGAATTWWLYVSMVHYGAVPPVLGALAVLALSAFLALAFALLGWAWWPMRHRPLAPLLWAMGWLLAEWLRGVLFSGFPWGNVATAHVDGLGVLAPWLGALGVGAVASGLAALVATRRSGRGLAAAAALALVAVWPQAPWSAWDWSQTRAHGSARVSLLQGNIDQAEKFDPERGIPFALNWYPTAIAEAPPGDLIVAPETAIPLLPQDLGPQHWRAFAQALAARADAVAIGVPLGSFASGYQNAVWWWTPQRAARALAKDDIAGADLAQGAYSKVHLVPFGEYTPWGFRWFAAILGMPLNGFQPGSVTQAPMAWAGQRWGFQVCYEDVFGAELAARMAHDAPTVWVNVSNIAWFGNTVAVPQHLNIARWRARETGRSVVRATNTGATAIIDHLGRVQASLPPFTRGVLSGQVQGREGLTPYVRWIGRWGDWPWVLLALAMWSIAWLRRGRSPS